MFNRTSRTFTEVNKLQWNRWYGTPQRTGDTRVGNVPYELVVQRVVKTQVGSALYQLVAHGGYTDDALNTCACRTSWLRQVSLSYIAWEGQRWRGLYLQGRRGGRRGRV